MEIGAGWGFAGVDCGFVCWGHLCCGWECGGYEKLHKDFYVYNMEDGRKEKICVARVGGSGKLKRTCI